VNIHERLPQGTQESRSLESSREAGRNSSGLRILDEKILRLALDCEEDASSLQVLGDLIQVSGWLDLGIVANLIKFGVRSPPLQMQDEFLLTVKHEESPTQPWARTIAATLLFGSWPEKFALGSWISRNAEEVRNARRGMRTPIVFPRTLIPAGERRTMRVSPAVPVLLERLVFPTDISVFLVVHSFATVEGEMFVSPIPGEIFSSRNLGSRLMPGQWAEIEVENVSDAALDVNAAILCQLL
jgi:hypothetical protein